MFFFRVNTILVSRGDEVLGFSSYGKPGMLEGIANDNSLFSKQMIQTIPSQSCVFSHSLSCILLYPSKTFVAT